MLDARGSSSVQPFLNRLANDYTDPKIYPKRNIEISVQAGGSALGITSVANNQTMIGTASKSPRDSVEADQALKTAWQKEQIKTITLAKDGIALLLYAPAGYVGTDFAVSSQNIDYLYRAFSGYENVPLSEFLINTEKSSAELKNINLHGFARSGGASASGTAEAFFLDSGLSPQGNYSEQVTRALENGIYGPNTTQTNESNAEAYGNFEINAPSRGYGSMIYLSLGYVQNNLQKINDDGFIVVSYLNPNTNNVVQATTKNAEPDASGVTNYDWLRPFNAMISLTRIEQEKKENNGDSNLEDFINWILFSEYGYSPTGAGSDDPKQAETDISDIYGAEGAIRLQPAELGEMFLTASAAATQALQGGKLPSLEDFWQPDYKFANGTWTFGVE